MKIHIYKNQQMIMFGITYCKDLFVDGQRVLTFSFWTWDLELEWNR